MKQFRLVLLAASPAFSQNFYYTEQIPPLARAGERVKIRYRADGITRLSFPLTGTQTVVESTPAGPGFFDLDFVAPPYEARYVNVFRVGFGTGFNGDAAVGRPAFSIRYGENLPPVRITNLAPDVQRSDYIFNIHSRTFYDGMIANGVHVFAAEPLARRMYEFLGDDFDFINVIAGSVGNIANRYHGSIRNSVSGIGRDVQNTGAAWGSARRLLGFSMYPNQLIYDTAESGANHETGHQWISAVRGAPFGIGVPHWPFSSMATGIMGYSDPVNRQGLNFPCRFTPQADGSVVVSFGSPFASRFTDFDLYLMGLLDAAEIRDPQYVITDSAKTTAAASSSCAGAGTLTPGQFQTVRITDLIAAAGGPRVPSAANSQKDFRTANIVVSRDGLLTPNEMAYFEQMARRNEERDQIPSSGGFSGMFIPWFKATREKSTMTARLTSAELPTITAGGVVNAATFTGAAMGPGVVGSIFGSALSATTASATAVPLPTTLSGVRVFVNNRPAPLFFVSPTQINFQMPSGLPTHIVLPGDPAHITSVRVERDGMSSNHAYVEVRPTALGIITYGDNLAVAVRPNGTVVGPDNPAIAGEFVTVYWVGVVPTSESVAAGDPAPPDRLIRVNGPTTALLSGNTQGVQFNGLTPGGVGLYQLNMQILFNTPAGEHPFTINVNSVTSNRTRLFVRRP